MKPLSKKRRTISLITLLVLFIIAVPILISYSSGLRFNFSDFNFVETGGVYIHSDLSNTNVFINDKFVKNSGTILRNVLVQNLLSEENYSIRVEKEDLYPYYKDVSVYPNMVTEIAVMMLPMEIEFEKVIKTASSSNSRNNRSDKKDDLEFTDDYLRIIDLFELSTTTDKDIEEKELELVVETPFNSKASTTKIVLNNQEINLLPEYILKLDVDEIYKKELLRDEHRIVTWLESGNIHIIWSGKTESTPYYLCDNRGCRDKTVISLDSPISYYDFYPSRNDVLVVSTQNDIFSIEIDDRSKRNMQPIYSSSTSDPIFRLLGNTIFIQDGEDYYKAEI